MTGLLAGFGSEPALRAALRSFAGWPEIETYTPMPIESERGGSALPLAMLIAGAAGFTAFFLLMTYADVRAYPQDIGGRPNFAWPAFIPIAFELGVLCAMVTGFFGYFALCRLPRLYDPIDECDSLKGASRDGWFLAIRTEGPGRLEEARQLLATLRPVSLEEFAA
jgi:Protein of unknown function (DUF3341)